MKSLSIFFMGGFILLEAILEHQISKKNKQTGYLWYRSAPPTTSHKCLVILFDFFTSYIIFMNNVYLTTVYTSILCWLI